MVNKALVIKRGAGLLQPQKHCNGAVERSGGKQKETKHCRPFHQHDCLNPDECHVQVCVHRHIPIRPRSSSAVSNAIYKSRPVHPFHTPTSLQRHYRHRHRTHSSSHSPIDPPSSSVKHQRKRSRRHHRQTLHLDRLPFPLRHSAGHSNASEISYPRWTGVRAGGGPSAMVREGGSGGLWHGRIRGLWCFWVGEGTIFFCFFLLDFFSHL